MSITRLTNAYFFQIINQQYGESMLADVRRLEWTRMKYGKYSNHL